MSTDPPLVVSTHAPTRGATRLINHWRFGQSCFNPRAHAGRDLNLLAANKDTVTFQPTRPRGARRDQLHAMDAGHLFQPTRPRGARRVISMLRRHEVRFNPRAHAGREPNVQAGRERWMKFQPTRPRGARHRLCRMPVQGHQFQPTRSRGARPPGDDPRGGPVEGFNPRAHAGRDRRPGPPARRCRCFNPRAHAGRDFAAAWRVMASRSFQPTRPRGARPTEDDDDPQHRAVSTHAPTRGATLCVYS